MGFQQGPQTVYTVGVGNLDANLLVKQAADGTAVVNTATPADLAVGVTYVAGLIGASIPICGIDYGIISIQTDAGGANINAVLYAAAGGRVTMTAGGRAIGVAKTTAAAVAGTLVDVIPMPLILTAAALAASVAITLTLSAGSAFSLGSMGSAAIYLIDSTFTNGLAAVSGLDFNFQTLGLRYQRLLADYNDLRTKIKTTLIVQ